MNVRLKHEPGEFIGPGKNQYKVVETIKSGGMGTVYKVENVFTRHLYAVKECDLLDDPRGKQISRPDALQIFIREARLLESLKFPGLPVGFLLVDAGVDLRICLQCGKNLEPDQKVCPVCRPATGSLYAKPQRVRERYYLFMEYIPGEDAEQRVAAMTRPLVGPDLATVRSWVRDISVIVSFLHDQGLVHRDIKPENIRIQKGETKVFLLDFGLLEDLNGASGENGPSPNLGTEGYAPPEQGVQTPTHANDVYALAATYLAMASGLDPTNPMEHRRLTSTDPKTLVPDLHSGEARLIAASLSDNPKSRPTVYDWVKILDEVPGSKKGTIPLPDTRNASGAVRYSADDPPIGSAGKRFTPASFRIPPSVTELWRRHARHLLWTVTAVVLVLLLFPIFFSGEGSSAYEVKAREGAIIYPDPSRLESGRSLNGGEILKVKTDDKVRDNWLRVLSVDGSSHKGYVKRQNVDVFR